MRAHVIVSGIMSLERLAVRQALGLAQAVGFYLLVGFGAPLVAMVVMAFVGYVPFSDRPGAGLVRPAARHHRA